MRRLTRLTLAFSKKRENFEAAVGLHFAYYNFVKRHNTLRCTPAMAAGVSVISGGWRFTGGGSMSTVPQELNWVEKSAACKVAEVFHQLCIEIGNDIIAINGIKYKELYFKQESLRDGTIVIGQPNRTPRLTVSIGVVDQQITVRDQATPTNGLYG